MSAAFTPGPWTAERVYVTRNEPDMRVTAQDGHRHVADVGYSDDPKNTIFTRDVEEMRANAFLIAAAPELLAALQEARETLAMLTDPERIQQSRVQIAWAQAVAAEAKARAAIAKATGKE